MEPSSPAQVTHTHEASRLISPASSHLALYKKESFHIGVQGPTSSDSQAASFPLTLFPAIHPLLSSAPATLL